MLDELFLSVVEARLHSAEVEVEDLLLFGELLLEASLYDGEIDGQKLRHDADEDHVADELAQLGLGTDGGGDLVEGNGIAGYIVAVLFEVEAFFVDGSAASGQREHVLLGSLGVQRHQDFRIALAGYVALFAGANGVPGGESGDVGGEEFFPLTGTPIPKMLFSSTLLADWEPDPFTVATLMLKSFVTRACELCSPCS